MYPAPHFLRQDEWVSLKAVLRLSKREGEILSAAIEQRTEQEIATQLQLSVSTVHTYIGRLYRKLGVDNRCGAIVRLFEAYVALQTVSRADVISTADLH